MTGEGRLWAALDESLRRFDDPDGIGFWLRDDDAVAPTPALDRLIALTEEAGIPLALAVIPGKAEAALARRLEGLAGIYVLQHGYVHANHAAAGAKKCELGDDRDIEVVLSELRAGRDRLAAFSNVEPMLVPPWNRIGAAVASRLSELGFVALSLYGPREAARDAGGLLRLNTHLDPVDWRGTRGFVGREAMLAMILKHLDAVAARRTHRDEPVGILTHHLVHDAETFDFLRDLFRAIGKHSHARWFSVETLLRLGTSVQGGDAP